MDTQKIEKHIMGDDFTAENAAEFIEFMTGEKCTPEEIAEIQAAIDAE